MIVEERGRWKRRRMVEENNQDQGGHSSLELVVSE